MTELGGIEQFILPLAVGVVAFLYSSVGHGGATGYLALAALLGLDPTLARPGALWMNCFVAGIAFYRFHQAGFFDSKVFLPLAAASIPTAWMGSRMPLTGAGYALMLGGALFAAGWCLVCRKPEQPSAEVRQIKWWIAVPIGAVLGLLAGMTGIGGGVFLTPLLILLNWTPAKVAGGVSALFILVNSAAGLVGLGGGSLPLDPMLISTVVAGVTGAILGTHFGVSRWHVGTFGTALAMVVWLAAGKLVVTGN